MVHGARRGDDLRRGHARHRDPVRIDLRGEALGEALEGGLLGAVAGAAAHAGRRILVGPAAGADGGAGADVDDGASLALDHVAQHELAQHERRVHVDRP